MIKDRNFDDIIDKFATNIYGTTKGRIREAILWQDIETILMQFNNDQPLRILDAGGGQGKLACKLAKLGHDVTICDISAQMLAVAKLHAQAENVKLHYINAAIQDLASQISQPFDIVLCHAVLEWVQEPQVLLTSLKKLLKSSGFLSLMFYNLHGLIFRTATLGNFNYLSADSFKSGINKRKKKTLSPNYPRKPDDVYLWLNDLDFYLIQKTGIRVFHDFLVDKTQQQTQFNELLELEKTFCRQEPYLQLARYIHVIAKLS